MALHQRAVAQFQSLIEDLPELFDVAAGGQRHIGQVDGDHALVEAAVILRLAVFIDIRGQEAAAAHAGIAVTLAVFVDLELEHHLFGDIIGHHALGGALGCQLRQIIIGRIVVDVVLLQHIDQLGEGRGDPNARFVLDALIALLERFFDDESEILLFLLVPRLVEVHEHRHKRRLAVGGQQSQHLILDGLHAPCDLVAQAAFHKVVKLLFAGGGMDLFHLRADDAADLFAADLHKGRQVRQGNRLAAVLVRGVLRDDLGGDIAGGGEGMRALDQRAGDDRAVLEHILQIDQVTVVHMLGIIIGIVKMDDAFLVRLNDILGQQQAVGDISGNLARHIVALRGVDDGVLVGVFLLGLFVAALDQAQDLVIGGVAAAHQRAGIAIGDILLGHLKRAVRHDLVLDHILNLFHRGRTAELDAIELHGFRNALNLHRRHAMLFLDVVIGFSNGN